MDRETVACALDRDGLAERSRRWQALAERTLVDVGTIPTGLRLRFRAEPGVQAELDELAALERVCCAFADWSTHASGDEVAVEVKGRSEEGIAAAQAMFAGLRAAA